jgi:hypothetical protein
MGATALPGRELSGFEAGGVVAYAGRLNRRLIAANRDFLNGVMASLPLRWTEWARTGPQP